MTTVVKKIRAEYAETAEFFMKFHAFHGYVFSPEELKEVVSCEL